MDLTKSQYETFDELKSYMYGSAAVIGLEMLPILGTRSAKAYESAEKLGYAFQLANFIRDIDEDLDRDRIYLPQDELNSLGVTNEMLRKRTLTPQIISAIQMQIARVRTLQSEAEDGISFLSKESQPCIRAASELYCGIVDEVEAIDYDVFNKRAMTSTRRKMKVAGGAFLRTLPLSIPFFLIYP